MTAVACIVLIAVVGCRGDAGEEATQSDAAAAQVESATPPGELALTDTAVSSQLYPGPAPEDGTWPDTLATAAHSGVMGLPGTVYIEPGPERNRPLVRNPYEGDARAIADGERLYSWYNCGGCHGPNGGGGMGPNLRDEDWIYGDGPVDIFRTIAEGRPEGMPTWAGKIPETDIWKIVAHIQSMGGGG